MRAHNLVIDKYPSPLAPGLRVLRDEQKRCTMSTPIVRICNAA
jgi:hypothetical protein